MPYFAEPNGTISEVELHTMRNRLDRGRLNKATRGELFLRLPTGYAFSPTRQVVLVDFPTDGGHRDKVYPALSYSAGDL